MFPVRSDYDEDEGTAKRRRLERTNHEATFKVP